MGDGPTYGTLSHRKAWQSDGQNPPVYSSNKDLFLEFVEFGFWVVVVVLVVLVILCENIKFPMRLILSLVVAWV